MPISRIIAPAFLSLAVASLLGCAAPSSSPATVTWGPVRTYSGSYVPGWEFSDFTVRGSTATWWLSGNLERIRPFEEGYHPHGVRLFITVEGQLSSPGRYGHLSRFPHELRVIRVISVRQLHEASNQALQPTPVRLVSLLPDDFQY